MSYQHDLDLLKFIWDNRNPNRDERQNLFNVSIEPLKKPEWNRYTIWVVQKHDLINISEIVYQVIYQFKLKDAIRLWTDRIHFCRPSKVETTGFVNFMLFQFYDGIARILLEAGLISETEAAEKSYTFNAANYFKRLL